MDVQGFQNYLEDRNLSAIEIADSVEIAQRFDEFFNTAGRTQEIKEAVNAFSVQLIESGENTFSNYYALARYGRFLGNNDIYVGVIDLLDGAEAMGNLQLKAEKVLGASRLEALFEDIVLSPLGLPNRDKVTLTQKVMPRLVQMADSQECDQILSGSLRDLQDAWFKDDKASWEDCHTLDEYLDKNGQNFIAMLEKIRDEGGLFFTQAITDEVIEFVRNEPLIARGVREGDTLYEVKIPHMTIEYLAESDERLKRYYYCHCPWVKEALKEGDSGIPPVFCSCSAGFHKKKWEVLLEQPLKAEIVESVLKGDERCMIAIHLPAGLA